jgi:O-antigen ligase
MRSVPGRSDVATAQQGSRPDLLLFGVAGMLLTYVWRVQDVFPVLGMVKLGLLAAGATLLSLASAKIPIRRFAAIRSPVLTAALIILALMILGLPTSLWAGKSFTFVTRDFGPSILLLVAVAASVRSFRDLEWLAFAALVGGVIYAAFVFLNFEVQGEGRLGDLVYYDANDFALLLVCTLPIALYFVRRGTESRRRVVAAVAIPLLMVMIVRSGSRGGFLALLAVAAYIALRFRAFPVRKRLGAVLAGVFLLALAGNAAYWEQMSTLLKPKEDYNWSGGDKTGRMEIWKRGMGYMLQRPITGVGARAFQQAEGTLSAEARAAAARGRGWKWSTAHNSLVEIGAEVGVPGLVAFLAMLTFAFSALRRTTRLMLSQGPRAASALALSQALTASLLGFAVAGFFLSAAYSAYLYGLLGLVLGLTKLVRWQAAPAAVPAPLPVAAPAAAPSSGRAPAAWRSAASAAARAAFERQATATPARPALPPNRKSAS